MSRTQITPILVAVLLWFLGTGTALADEKPPAIKVGQIAPDLAFHKLLQAPDGAQVTRDALKGQVVVLEFWATWCKGCVEAIPHMNELAGKFADKPVRFIAITNEEESKVLKFLEKQSIKSWVGLESKGAMSRAFDVQMIPRTILIDREGKIAGMTSPEQLTEQHLNDVLAGKPVQFKPDVALFLEEYIEEVNKHEKVPERQRLFELSIQPVRPTSQPSGTGTPGDFSANGLKLRDIIWLAYGVRPNRVQGSIPILDQSFSVRHRVMTLSPAHASRMLQDTLCTVLGLAIRKETQEVEAYVLTLPGKPGPGLKPPSAEQGSTSDRNGIYYTKQPVEKIAEWLEYRTTEPVLNETGLKGRFDFDLTWIKNKDNLQKSFKEMEEQLGLRVTRLKRPVEFLVVEYAQER